MSGKPSTGALDEDVGLQDQLRPDIDYDRRRGADLLDLLGDIRGKRILDFGCGKGTHRAPVEARGATWVGLELGGGDATVVADGDRMPFADGSFDGVLCAAVLEHMPEPDRTVSEIHRVLADGGFFFGYVAFLEPFHGLSYNHMSHLGLQTLLFRHGFRPLRIFPAQIGAAYQIECMLFPTHVPVVRPLCRWVLQKLFALLLLGNRFAREIIQTVRPGRGAKTAAEYRRLLDLTYAAGFNFIARKEDVPERLRAGYGSLVTGE